MKELHGAGRVAPGFLDREAWLPQDLHNKPSFRVRGALVFGKLDTSCRRHQTWHHVEFTATEEYSAASAYNAKFEGMVNSYMMEAVWKTWSPPKCKLFAWLILQNRVWTADRLQKRGWPNCGNCQLTRVNSANVQDEGLWIGERQRLEIPGARLAHDVPRFTSPQWRIATSC
jgi:hypothetical protein